MSGFTFAAPRRYAFYSPGVSLRDLTAPLFVVSALLLTCRAVVAQPQQIENWSAHYVDPAAASNRGEEIKTDKSGNAFVRAPGRILKYSRSGQLLWTLSESAAAIALDPDGNLLLCRQRKPGVPEEPDGAIVTCKYDSDARLLWKASSGYMYGEPMGLEVDSKGIANVCWSSWSQSGDRYVIIDRFSAEGVWIGQGYSNTHWGEKYTPVAWHMTPEGDVWVLGSYWADIEPYEWSLFVLYYGSGATFGAAPAFINWRGWPPHGRDEPIGLAVDNAGYAYVTGYYSNSGGQPNHILKFSAGAVRVWDRIGGPGRGFQTSAVGPDGCPVFTNGSVLAKYDTEGAPLWGVPAGGSDVEADAASNLYVTGSQTAKVDPSGRILWTALHNDGGSSVSVGRAVDIGSLGDIYVSGDCTTSGVQRVLTVQYAASLATLTASPSTLHAGAQLTIDWIAKPIRKDWVGLYRVGSGDEQYLWWAYTADTLTGSRTIDSPATPGQYEFRYFTNNSFERAAVSNPVTIFLPDGYGVQASPPLVSPGQLISVSFTANSVYAAPKDWVGLFKVGDANRQWMEYRYTGGAASGALTFTAPSTAGTYEFRYLYNDRFTALASSNKVEVFEEIYRLAAAPATAPPGGTITVTWEAPAGSSSLDWIGLYPEGQTDNRGYLWSSWSYTGGAVSGSRSFSMPSAPGRYLFRYLLNDGYSHRAESSIVTVQ